MFHNLIFEAATLFQEALFRDFFETFGKSWAYLSRNLNSSENSKTYR